MPYIVTRNPDPDADETILTRENSIEACMSWLDTYDTEDCEEGEKRYIHEVRSPVVVRAKIHVTWERV